MISWKNVKRPRKSHRSLRQPRSVLNLEPLEERALLDGGPVQFGSQDAFVQYLVNTALTQYHDLFGQHFQNYVPWGGPVFLQDQQFVPAAFNFASAVSTTPGSNSFSG